MLLYHHGKATQGSHRVKLSHRWFSESNSILYDNHTTAFVYGHGKGMWAIQSAAIKPTNVEKQHSSENSGLETGRT